MPLQQPPWREAYESLRLPRLDMITRFFSLAAASWCAAALQCHGRCAVVQGGHSAGVAGCGVLRSHGLRRG